MELKQILKETSIDLEKRIAALDGTIDKDFELPIVGGAGSVRDSQRTFGVTLTGHFEIISPDEGTWSIVVIIKDKKVVDVTGVTKGQQIPFTAKTRRFKKTDFDIQVKWNKSEGTTLKVHLKASY